MILNTNLNEEVNFSKLSINVKYCYQNPINMEIENYAYIKHKRFTSKIRLFLTGWMFSSTPSINSLEHPINDIWLLNVNNKIKLFQNLKVIIFRKKPFR